MTRRTAILFCIYLTLTLAATLHILYTAAALIDLAYTHYQHQQNQLMQNLHILEQDRLEQIDERLKEIEDIFSQAETFTITAYAPLDPAAIPGMCFSGDPNVTASGSPPVPGETVAAGPTIPFGSRVWIEGIGIRTVND